MIFKTHRLHVFTVLGLFFVLGVCPVFGAGRKFFPDPVVPIVAKMSSQGRLPATEQLHLTFSLPLRNEPELDDLIHRLYDPASPNYRQFITPQEFTARFGPTKADYATLLEFVRTNGFEIVGTHPNRLLVDVVGTASTAERVFGVTLKEFRHPKESRDFFAPDTEPSVAAPVTLLNVSGLDNYSLPHPNLKQRPSVKSAAATPYVGSGPGGSYRGNDFRAAYVPGTTLTGAGQSVGLLQFDGYYTSDIAAYISQAGISTSVVLTNVLINGGVATPGSGAVEVCLDIEMAISMAPGLDKIIVYEAPNGGTAWSTILSRMANDNFAKQLSCSWGGGSPDAASEQIFKQMAAQGQSFFNASGDSDAFTGSVPFPSDSTNITQVGGTTLTTSGAGGPYVSETTWNWGGGTGSSGGVSTYYQIPNWQASISMVANGGSTTYRNIPDVALTGDNVYVVYTNGATGVFGGTSCAAPLWAGYCALINQQAALAAKPPVGFLNPILYAMANNGSYSANFHDITTGNNTSSSSPSQYYAVAGYDLCTGLGTPNGTNLINALAPLVFAASITAGNWMLQAESATPANEAIDPGETVGVSFTLLNQGNLATSNLVATLQPSANVLAPGEPQSYGVLAAFGGSASRTFVFTSAGSCGSNIVATLQLQDGTNNLGMINFILRLGKVSGLTENFDGVTAPGLPAGWSSMTVTGTSQDWETTSVAPDTSPNSAFDSESADSGENALVSPVIPITSSNAQLSFRHNYSFEYGGNGVKKSYYDGGVLEIQIGNGAFADILTAGGSFVSGGYNHTITTSSDNPLGGRSAWADSSGGWTTATVNLPTSAAGQNIRLRWNSATDSGNGGGGTPVGWYVDSISVSGAAADCLSVFTDLAVSQSLDSGSLVSGQNLVYTLSVTNSGPQPAANVILTDTVPANVTFVSASPGCTYSAGKVICPAGMLAAGVATNFTVTLAPAGGNVFTNFVSAGTVTPEITMANNQALLVSTQSLGEIPPQITLSPVAQTIECGGNASCSVTVSGTPPLVIQWSLDGIAVSGATNSTLSLTNVHLPDHVITVSVTNLYGSVSSNAVVNVLDTLAPAITLNGANPSYVELQDAFADTGATAVDGCAGPVPVLTSGTVDMNSVGTNTLTYTAGDGNGNTNSVTRTVIVRDTTAPLVEWSFTNLVVMADTNCSALMPDVTDTNYIQATDLSEPLTITQSPTNGTMLAEGTNFILLTLVDAYGNTAYSTNWVVVKDETPPVLTLNGADPLYVELGSVFSDPGAMAVDSCAGVLTVNVGGTIDTHVVGANSLAYTADDGSGNTNSVTRSVIVQDTAAPTIEWSFTNLLLAADTNCSAQMPDLTGTNYILATDLSEPLTITQDPTNGTALVEGTNLTLLTVVDAFGNTAYSTNQIVVQDETPPEITLNGADQIYLELGSPFVDPGAVATDVCAGVVPVTVSGTVETNVVGTNTLTYTAADSSGNTNSVTRTVVVQDTTAPTVEWSFASLVLAADANCSALMPDVTGTNYIQATDLSGSLVITQGPTNGTVLAEGTNLTLLTVVDSSGNTVYSTNQVVVQDATPPVITVAGANPLYVELGATFADSGATASDACQGVVPLLTSGSVDVNSIGTNTLTYTADDGQGNTNSATRTVVVNDTTPPAVVWSFTNLVLAAGTNCSGTIPDVTGTNYIQATDLSGVSAISQEPTNNAVLPLGTNVVVITVVDASGNVSYSTNMIVVKDQTPPVIVLQPESQTNNIGTNATLAVAVTDCTPVAFQWFFNDAILKDGTNDILSFTNLQTASAGDYFVVASSDGGSVTSAVAALTVLLTNNVVGSNGGVVLTLTGSPGLTYILEATTNLFPADWLPFDTNTLGTNGLWQFTDPQAAEYRQRFFRLIQLEP